jgi:hypothetical protein
MSGGSEGADRNAPEPRTDARSSVITRPGQDKQIDLDVGGQHVDRRLLSPVCR